MYVKMFWWWFYAIEFNICDYLAGGSLECQCSTIDAELRTIYCLPETVCSVDFFILGRNGQCHAAFGQHTILGDVAISAVVGRAGLVNHGIEIEARLAVFLKGEPGDFRLVFFTTTCIDALDADFVPIFEIGLVHENIVRIEIPIFGESIGDDGHGLRQFREVLGVESNRRDFLLHIGEQLVTQFG